MNDNLQIAQIEIGNAIARLREAHGEATRVEACIILPLIGDAADLLHKVRELANAKAEDEKS